MHASRRQFLRAATGFLIAPAPAGAHELSCDIAVIGGGVGGCAAALGAARNGMRVILTDETDWLGAS
jgi:NADPH-dependent 2,4-dienoyl-CoA reductase/sulfur reductase-like enzyme